MRELKLWFESDNGASSFAVVKACQNRLPGLSKWDVVEERFQVKEAGGNVGNG
jgi:hypothetical protein